MLCEVPQRSVLRVAARVAWCLAWGAAFPLSPVAGAGEELQQRQLFQQALASGVPSVLASAADVVGLKGQQEGWGLGSDMLKMGSL